MAGGPLRSRCARARAGNPRRGANTLEDGMKLRLELRGDRASAATEISGNNVAELCMQLPELLNELTRGIQSYEQAAVVYERETGEKVTVVRTHAGSLDAPAAGEREGRLLTLAGVRASEGVDGSEG